MEASTIDGSVDINRRNVLSPKLPLHPILPDFLFLKFLFC